MSKFVSTMNNHTTRDITHIHVCMCVYLYTCSCCLSTHVCGAMERLVEKGGIFCLQLSVCVRIPGTQPRIRKLYEWDLGRLTPYELLTCHSHIHHRSHIHQAGVLISKSTILRLVGCLLPWAFSSIKYLGSHTHNVLSRWYLAIEIWIICISHESTIFTWSFRCILEYPSSIKIRRRNHDCLKPFH